MTSARPQRSARLVEGQPFNAKADGGGHFALAAYISLFLAGLAWAGLSQRAAAAPNDAIALSVALWALTFQKIQQIAGGSTTTVGPDEVIFGVHRGSLPVAFISRVVAAAALLMAPANFLEEWRWVQGTLSVLLVATYVASLQRALRNRTNQVRLTRTALTVRQGGVEEHVDLHKVTLMRVKYAGQEGKTRFSRAKSVELLLKGDEGMKSSNWQIDSLGLGETWADTLAGRFDGYERVDPDGSEWTVPTTDAAPSASA